MEEKMSDEEVKKRWAIVEFTIQDFIVAMNKRDEEQKRNIFALQEELKKKMEPVLQDDVKKTEAK